MNRKTVQVAFSAVVAALSAVIMALAGVVPIATVALPAMAGIFAIPVVFECGVRWGFGVYAVVGVLSMLVTADREAALMYLVFFGYYPVLYALFGRFSRRWVQTTVKFLVFNAAMLLEVLAALFILQIPFSAMFIGGGWGIALMAVLLNILFWIYDRTIPGLIGFYAYRFHPMVSRLFRHK